MARQFLQEIEVVESEIRRRRFYFSCQNEAERNRDGVRHQDMVLLLVLVSMDCFNLSLPTDKGRVFRFISNLETHPLDSVFGLYKLADAALLQDCETRMFDSYDDFKHHLSESNKDAGALMGLAKESFVAWFQDHDPDTLRRLRTFLCFCKHYNVRAEALEEAALLKYRALETTLMVDGFTTEECELLARWFPSDAKWFFHDAFVGKHANGSTADAGAFLLDKYASLGKDQLLQYFLSRTPDTTPMARGLERCSKLVFVPKRFDTYRSISMEPAVLMYCQKGSADALFRTCLATRSEFLRRYDPTDQVRNRYLAQDGSIDGSYATIDLSDASDSVTWPMVRVWFRETFLRTALQCTRSTHTLLPTGEKIALTKFAPMGSALNFPIETAVFAAITETAINGAGGSPRKSNYAVYGDDIIVETRYYDAVVERLQRNGFKVNADKSYHLGSHGFFRESCGGHYYRGYDVTPAHISRKWEGLLCVDATSITGNISLANNLSAEELPRARLRVVRALLSMPEKLRPVFSEDGLQGVRSSTATNFHLQHRDSQRYQCEEIRYGSVRPKHSNRRRFPRDKDEEFRLFEWLRLSANRSCGPYSPETVITVPEVPTVSSWASAWHTR